MEKSKRIAIWGMTLFLVVIGAAILIPSVNAWIKTFSETTQLLMVFGVLAVTIIFNGVVFGIS